MVEALRPTYKLMELDRMPITNSHAYGKLICDKGGKTIQSREDSLNKVCWENWRARCKNMKLEHSLILRCTKIKPSKLFKY